jgi:hypothetical protein
MVYPVVLQTEAAPRPLRIDFYSEGARIRTARLKRLADVGSEPEDESSYSEAGHIVIDRE